MGITFNPADSAPFPQLRSAYLRAVARAWRDPAYEKRLSASPDAMKMLEDEYNFKFPFKVRLRIDDTAATRPQFRPLDTVGWFGFADEFKLWLPQRPVSKEDEASVLARYYQEFPSLLGQGLNGAEAPESFATFGLVTAQLIALVWRDEVFAQQLFHPPPPPFDDSRQLVEDALDCIVPWNFNLKFEPMIGPSVVEDVYWNAFPRSLITLHLPAKPDINVEAVALASYNATGGQYPFSCG